jgi:hypothetical protein
MARGIAIRSIAATGDGRFEVSYASGSPVAPAGTDGSFIFGSQAAVQEEVKALESTLSNYNLCCCTWRSPGCMAALPAQFQ